MELFKLASAVVSWLVVFIGAFWFFYYQICKKINQPNKMDVHVAIVSLCVLSSILTYTILMVLPMVAK